MRRSGSETCEVSDPGCEWRLGVVVSAGCSGVWGGWCLSVRVRLLPLGALPFRRARPQEPPACQTDLCSQMQPWRREEEGRRTRRGGGGGRRGEREEESRKKEDSRAKG